MGTGECSRHLKIKGDAEGREPFGKLNIIGSTLGRVTAIWVIKMLNLHL